MGRVWKKKCPVCGADFEAKLKNIKYCTACRALSTSVRERLMRERRAGKDVFATNYAVERGEMPAAKSETASRACHDCGRPTTDYRCPACRAAHLRKHSISWEVTCDERYLYA